MTDNNPLYALSILVKSYKLLIAYIFIATVFLFIFHSWYTSTSHKIVKFDIQNSQSIRLHLSNTDRNTLGEIGFGEATLFKIIKDLTSSEQMQKKVLSSHLNKENEDLIKNLLLINQSYSIQIDRKNKDEELKKYVVSFNTFLDAEQAQSFIKNLIIEAHQRLQKNVITNLLFEIDSVSKIVSYTKENYIKAINTHLAYLEILDKNFSDINDINRQKSMQILKNNLAIAEAAGFSDIQNQIFFSNLYEGDNLKAEDELIKNLTNGMASPEGKSALNLLSNKENLASEVYDFQKNKFINTYDELQSYSSNKPLYLLGSTILKKEIELLEKREYESMRNSRNNSTTNNILTELISTS